MKFYCYRVSWEFSVKTQRKILPEYQKSAKSQRARIRRCHGEMHRSSSVHSKRFQWYMCVAILNQSQMSKSFIEFFFFGPFTNRAQMVELHPAKTNSIWNCFHFSFRFRHIHFHLSFKLRRGSVLVRFTHKKKHKFLVVPDDCDLFCWNKLRYTYTHLGIENARWNENFAESRKTCKRCKTKGSTRFVIQT